MPAIPAGQLLVGANMIKFKITHFFLILTLSQLIVFACTLLAAESPQEIRRNFNLAWSLEKKFWRNIQNKKFHKASKMLASAYQELGPTGILNKKQQIDQFKKSNLLSFGIITPKATRKGNTLIFSYNLIAIGSGVISGPQMSVWKRMKSSSKTKPKWKMVSRSDKPFDPPPLPA